MKKYITNITKPSRVNNNEMQPREQYRWYYGLLALLAFSISRSLICSFLDIFLLTDEIIKPIPNDVQEVERSKLVSSNNVAMNLRNRKMFHTFNSSNEENTIFDNKVVRNSSIDHIITIAYAISLIKCGDFQSSVAGLTDAALVLRHSVHLTSVRNHKSGSKYDYKMYAFVHRNAESCSQDIQDAGYHVIVVDVPVTIDQIQDKYLQKHIHDWNCCGHDEFIKLYAYTLLDHPVVVHVDMDFLFYKPMDDLFDAIIYSSTSNEGREARSRIPIERPDVDTWPDTIDCFMTRDWLATITGRNPAFQAGLLVVRPSLEMFDTMINVIRTEEYRPGFFSSGWGGKGTIFLGSNFCKPIVTFLLLNSVL
jgi:hypothetical protein